MEIENERGVDDFFEVLVSTPVEAIFQPSFESVVEATLIVVEEDADGIFSPTVWLGKGPVRIEPKPFKTEETIACLGAERSKAVRTACSAKMAF